MFAISTEGLTWVVLATVVITFPCTVTLVGALTTPTVTATLYWSTPVGISTLAGNVNAVGFELVKVTWIPPTGATSVRYKTIAETPLVYIAETETSRISTAGITWVVLAIVLITFP